MNVPSAGVLSPGKLEISPTWTTATITHSFTESGERQARSQTAALSQLELRITFGLPAQWEVGIAIQGNWRFDGTHTLEAERPSVGIRRDLVVIEKRWALAAFAGLKLPVSTTNTSFVADVGLVQSYTPNSWLQVDISAGGLVESLTASPGFRYELGVGAYVLPEKLQLLAEWSHEWVWGPQVVSKGTLGVGVNWYLTPTIGLTFGFIVDLVGYNIEQGFIGYFSYTQSWDLPTATPTTAPGISTKP